MRRHQTLPLCLQLGLLAALLALPGCCYREPYIDRGPVSADDLLLKRDPAAEPAAPKTPFPARIAVARVGGAAYNRDNTSNFGVINSRTPSEASAAKKLAKLQSVAGVASINQLLVPNGIHGDYDLRVAASRIKADVLLIYVLRTSVDIDGVPLGPISVATLGLTPNKTATANVSATCVLIDVRTGFILGRAHADRSDTQLATMWHEPNATSAAIDHAEDEALDKLMDQFALCWRDVVKQHAN